MSSARVKQKAREKQKSKEKEIREKQKGRRGKLCVAFGCTNMCDSFAKLDGITFHSFPMTQPDRVMLWEQAIRRSDFHATRWSRICSVHFKPDCFNRSGSTVRLREGAVPTEFTFTVQRQSSNLVRMVPRSSVTGASEVIKMPVNAQLTETELVSVSNDHEYARKWVPRKRKVLLVSKADETLAAESLLELAALQRNQSEHSEVIEKH